MPERARLAASAHCATETGIAMSTNITEEHRRALRGPDERRPRQLRVVQLFLQPPTGGGHRRRQRVCVRRRDGGARIPHQAPVRLDCRRPGPDRPRWSRGMSGLATRLRRCDIAVPPECRELVQRGALVAVNHSGGKDSQCMTILLSRLVPREQLLVVHAPLGEVEWPDTLALIEADDSRRRAAHSRARHVRQNRFSRASRNGASFPSRIGSMVH